MYGRKGDEGGKVFGKALAMVHVLQKIAFTLLTANSILILWGNMSLNDHEKMWDQVQFTKSFKYPQEVRCMGKRGKALANITLQGDIFRHQFDGRPKTKQVAKITH